jgi:hypothetical protein
VNRPNPMERPDRVAAREDARAGGGLPPASEILMMQARDRRTDDERVSDALDRLQNRVTALDAAGRRILATWDDRLTTAGAWVDAMEGAIAELREVVR